MNDTVNFQIQALTEDTKSPIVRAKIQLENVNLAQSAITDNRGIASFSIKKSECLKPFKIKLNHKHYDESSISDRNLVVNSIKRRQKPFVLRFSKKLSLYFNGLSLELKRDKDTVKKFKAFSGKALNEKEMQRLRAERRYENFIAYKDGDFFDDEKERYFCLDDKDKCLESILEAEYYVNFKDFSQNDACKEVFIYESYLKAKEEKESKLKLYECFKYQHKKGICLNENFFAFLQEFVSKHFIKELILPLRVEYTKKSRARISYILENEAGMIDEGYLSLNLSFAPGSYVEFEAKNLEDIKDLSWGYVEAKSKQELDAYMRGEISIHKNNFTNIQETSLYNAKFQKEKIFHKIAFYLPLKRQDSFKEYFIMLFAFDASCKSAPEINDAFVVLDLGFRVGEGEDGSVVEGSGEGVWDEEEKNLKALNQQRNIKNLKEALLFLKGCVKTLIYFYEKNKSFYNKQNEEKNLINNIWLDYFKLYPQLAGKIAYIYYRFDLADEDFLKSVNGSEAYIKERKEFARKIARLYRQKYQRIFEKAFIDEKITISKESLIIAFIKDLGKEFNINSYVSQNSDKITSLFDVQILSMPELKINNKMLFSRFYDKLNNSLNLKIEKIFKGHKTKIEILSYILDNIIHEFRHFYIFFSHKRQDNDLMRYIYYNLNYFYDGYFDLFQAFHKPCLFFDETVFNCVNSKNTPLYYIQPSERDARICAYEFRKELRMTL